LFWKKFPTVHASLLFILVSAPEDSPYEQPNPEPAPDPREKPMGFFDHLEEMRWTIIKCAATFLIFACLIGVFLKEFNGVLLWPLNSVTADYPDLKLELGTTTIMEGVQCRHSDVFDGRSHSIDAVLPVFYRSICGASADGKRIKGGFADVYFGHVSFHHRSHFRVFVPDAEYGASVARVEPIFWVRHAVDAGGVL
jgi:hypothetical protein